MSTLEKLRNARKSKSRVLIGTKAGALLEGILINESTDDGYLEIQTDDKGIVSLYSGAMEYFSILDNLTHIERVAKQKGLV